MKIFLKIIFLFWSINLLYAQVEIKPELKRIELVGNNAIASADIYSAIFSKESPGKFSQFLYSFTPFGGEAIYFDSLLISLDISAIRQLYQSNGYFKVRISSKYEISENGREATLTYFIHESDPAIIYKIEARGLETIDPEYQDRLYEYVKLDTNQIYKDEVVETKKNFIVNFLRDHGFMLAQFDTPDIIVDTMKNRVDVNINFNPGRRYRISEIKTTRTGIGKDLVDDRLLKDIVGIQPGQWYSNYEVQRGQVRLYRTDLFTSAVVNSIIADTIGNLVPISISVDVGLLNELSPEIIVNNEDNTFNAGLGLNFTRKNFLGNARKLTISTSAAAQNFSEFIKNPSFADSTIFGYGDARIGVEQPFLFGKPITTKIEGYLTSQKRKDEYNFTRYGATLSFDFELPQITYFSSLNTYFNIERGEYVFKDIYLINLLRRYFIRLSEGLISPEEADSLASDFVYKDLGGKLVSQSTNALLGFTVGTNKTNNLFFPTEGYTLSFQVEDANSIPYLFSRIFKSEFTRSLYLKTTISTTAYLPIYKSPENALGIKLRLGQIFTYRGDKAQIPINQRLYAGGSNSVRGWSTRQLVPNQELLLISDPTVEELENILLESATTGGFFLLEGSIETRNRLFGQFGSAFFIDYGNTWNSPKEFRFDELAIAAGFGLRFYTDFAPFRIDFGIKIYDPMEKRFTLRNGFWNNLFKNYLQFHIGIGEAF